MAAAAPLVATADAPIPEGARAFWYEGAGGARLRAAIVPCEGPARGSVVLSPGRTEPIEKYFETAGELQARGFFVLLHDWRGQGLSHRVLPDRLKGHAAGHGDFLEDFRALLAEAQDQLPQPWVALGHSMGGALTALDLARADQPFAAALLTAPMMGLTAVRQLPRAAHLIARAAQGIGRAGDYVVKGAFNPMLGPFEGNILTHDARRYERYRAQLAACPDLALGGVTWGWLAFALGAGVALSLLAAARAVDIPVTVLAAGEDQLVLNAPSRAYAGRLRQGRYAEIAGAYHEMLMETDARRALVWREFDDLLARAGV